MAGWVTGPERGDMIEVIEGLEATLTGEVNLVLREAAQAGSSRTKDLHYLHSLDPACPQASVSLPIKWVQ